MTLGEPSASATMSRLKRPIEEARFLLDRGYRRSHAFRVVGEHHQLAKDELHALERVVFAAEESARRRARLLRDDELAEQRVAVDGYNVLIGLRSWEAREPLFLADDGVLRDVAAGRGLREVRASRALILQLGRRLVELGVGSVSVILDRQVSRSGQLARAFRQVLDELGVEGRAETAARADGALIALGEAAVVCSSDRVIIDAVPRAYDLVRSCIGEASDIGEPPPREAVETRGGW